MVLINMYRKTKKPIYLQKAIQIAEQLIENMITENGKVGWKSEVVPEVLAGFAHGNSGFIELFSRLYEVYPQTKYLDILSSLVEYENSLYSEKDNNWIDLRKFSEVDQHKSQPIAWCHGAAGILLSRLTLYNAIKNLGETALLQQAIKDISLAKNKLIEDGVHAGFCLCHGNMGNLLILKRYAEIFDDKQVRSICDSRFEQILKFLNEENILPTELYNPGFMTGLSGIAYALLKYKMPKLPLLIGVEGEYMIEMKFSKNDEEDGLFRISSRDIVGFYNCSSKQERKITDIIKCYGTTKSIKEVELKNMKPEDNVISRYIERNVGSIINKDYVIEGFLGMGKLSDCKDEMVSRLDISKRYCLEILVAFLQEADIIILHEMFENVWNHTIEEILVEFSLRGAVVVFSEHGEESLMKLPMHSYDLSGRCVGW